MHTTSSTKKRVFAVPKSEEEIDKAKVSAIPEKTLTDAKYCSSIWNQWCEHQFEVYGDRIPPLEQLASSYQEFALHLSNEVRKKTGEEFPPKSLHHIVIGIQRHVRMHINSAIDIFKDPEFAEFQTCLDPEMKLKRLQRSELGTKTKKAEPLSLEEEETLWQKGLLGKSSPQVLVDTILFMNEWEGA